jgi:hypothetical protein
MQVFLAACQCLRQGLAQDFKSVDIINAIQAFLPSAQI